MGLVLVEVFVFPLQSLKSEFSICPAGRMEHFLGGLSAGILQFAVLYVF